MIYFPNCKINLGLRVLNKRNDGFHNIDSLLVPVPLYDALEIIPSSGNNFLLDTSGLILDSNPGDNLVVKAYKLLKKQFDIPAVKIHLHKMIPVMAGLGGGSSDAANMLLLLTRMFNLPLNNTDLIRISAELGSDCPFFIENKSAIVSGRGDVFKTFDFSLQGYTVVIVKPEIHISTQEAYSYIAPCDINKSVEEIIKMPIHTWKAHLKNDFENYFFREFPDIKEIKNRLYTEGAIYASLSGSGSAVYGIFENSLCRSIIFRDHFYWQRQL